jgi:hypothetical protein
VLNGIAVVALHGFVVQIQLCLLIGSYVMATAGRGDGARPSVVSRRSTYASAVNRGRA